MQYAYDHTEYWRRPTKRRRISPSSTMARINRREESPPNEGEGHERYSPGEADQPDQRSSSREEIRTSDREELIQCIKRGERPTWVPKPSLEALCAQANAQVEISSARDPDCREQPGSVNINSNTDATLQPRLPSPPRDPIPRPPSALHAGDFYEPRHRATQDPENGAEQLDKVSGVPISPHNASLPPWLLDGPPPRFLRAPSDPTATASSFVTQRSRAPSLGSSLSSSFVMRTPTSPLVHATSSPSLDLEEQSERPRLEDKALRRRTLPPQSFHSASFLQTDLSTSTPVPAIKRQVSTPHRTHQSRRSLTSFTYQPASSAQGVYPSRNRRLSHASETSPRSLSSMVGSFEESILRGRMSTPPSKPLDFVAQIGVLGKGDCPARLKCPAHVSVPFPAVFYSYASTNGSRSITDDSPSPYVGTIDLEQHLKPVEDVPRRKRRADSNDPDTIMAELTGPRNTSIGRALARQEPREPRKILLEGAYRVPQQGQLQVVIKNPNKTAVKLFLIPYDLEGMSPGTKTFVRQRSFSSGPIVENVLSKKPVNDPLSNKQILRYLIHLKFCCTSKGKFYLYDNIRVVFANRVPEGKEKLRNEIQVPEPKYSPFVAGSRSRMQSLADSPNFSPTSMSGQYQMSIREPKLPSSDPDALFSSAAIPLRLGHSVMQTASLEQTAGLGAAYAPNQDSTTDARQTSHTQSPEVYGFDRVSTSQRGSPVPWSSGLDLAPRRSPSPALGTADGLLSRIFLGKQQHPSSSHRDSDEPSATVETFAESEQRK